MKVQGVDPVIMSRIQEKVKKQLVQESRQVEFAEDRQNSHEQERETPNRDELAAAVQKLNKTADSLGINLLFVLLEDDAPRIFALNRTTQELIHQLSPAKVQEMLTEMKSFVGMMVDQLS
ncbi:MAG: flagellar protein FlaG [Dethiobacter sp.]|nr:flagellar protein FlaG [Dethiobacter sp.]MBS3902170.1 flagellar protein FlaG [Dethiobacter sp.]MBS3989679.1 flagellar protein FlaG [Dethiobacter sp.]